MESKLILFESGAFWISNEGSSKHPYYHVWKNGITHATIDSAYTDLSLAIARVKYLNKF